jgi:short-subunit dehydrogenase
VITGASSGIGRELTFKYAERGCKIVIGSRNIKELEAVNLKIT